MYASVLHIFFIRRHTLAKTLCPEHIFDDVISCCGIQTLPPQKKNIGQHSPINVITVTINRLQQKSDPDFLSGVQVSRAGNYMCKFAFEKAVEKLLNYISTIKTLKYPVANRFIVYRIE